MDDVRPRPPRLPRRLGQALRHSLAILGILLLAGCRSVDSVESSDLTSRVRAIETSAAAHALPGWSVLDTNALNSLAAALRRQPHPCSAPALQTTLFPRLTPSDSIHSPGEALRTGRGSCLAFTCLVVLLRERCHCDPTDAFVLPGHVTPGWNGIYFETLRQGTLRDSAFYRSHFSLSTRPWYRNSHGHTDSILIGILWHDLGLALAQQENCRSASEAFDQALKHIPDHPPTLLALSRCEQDPAKRLQLEAKALLADPVISKTSD